jgi:hypothetical protein
MARAADAKTFALDAQAADTAEVTPSRPRRSRVYSAIDEVLCVAW